MWFKLEQLFMTKALPTQIYLKQKFMMDKTKSIDDNIGEFIKLVSDLEILDIQIDEED